jgi:hypothetical protein
MAAPPQPAHVYWSVVFDGEAPPPSVLRSEAVLELAGRPSLLPIATDVELAFLRREGGRPELVGMGRGTLVGSVHYRLEHVTRIVPTAVGRAWLDKKVAALPASIGSVRCTLQPMAEVEASEAQAIVRERAGRILEGAEAPETEAESEGVTESPVQAVEVETKSPTDPIQGLTVSAWLEHRLSPAVRQIVDLAERLAAHAGADESVTSTHLLDAILNVGLSDQRRKGGDTGAAARFVRMLNARNEGFVPTRSIEAPPPSADLRLDRTVAADAAAIFAAAVALAQRFGQADRAVSARLLVFALLDADTVAVSAHDLLRSAGFDPRELRQAFLQSLADEGIVDERPSWQAILFTPRLGDQRRWLPSFNADLASGEDKLGLRPDIDAMASLIVSRSLHPPLSIGLFGNWGSGKSFFMQKLREQIRDLARDRTEESRGLYWPNVVTVEFNAWHYVDANLWASLVAHLFGQLRLWGSPEDGVAEQVRKQKNAALNQLKVASEAREAAQKRLGDAERALDQARKRHDDAVGSVRLNTYTLGVQLARNLWAELKEKPELSAPLQEAAKKLHEAHLAATDSVDSVERLHAQLKELGESGGRLRATGWLMLHGPGRRSALLWLLGGTALALGLSFKAVGTGFDFGPVASIVTQAAAIVIAGAQWITRSAAEVSRLAKPMEAIRQKIEHSLQALTDERNRMVAKFQKGSTLPWSR